MDLDAIPFKQTRHPGVSVHFYDTDPDTGRTVVLIRMAAGARYPGHRHRGAEEVLVLQGGFEDGDGSWRAGEFVRFPDGSSHEPVALAGDDCVLFAIAAGGIDLER